MSWINVNDRLPKRAERVLVSVRGGGFAVRTTGLWTGKIWKLGSLEKGPSETSRPIEGKVEAWMPLPLPY
jgi:hypothetical protein